MAWNNLQKHGSAVSLTIWGNMYITKPILITPYFSNIHMIMYVDDIGVAGNHIEKMGKLNTNLTPPKKKLKFLVPTLFPEK